jgi:hypothetical protein
MSDSEVDRRRFLALMTASAALAKLAGCTRQPPEEIVPYVRQPEELVQSTLACYATAMVQGGVATGLLARSQMGRPIKIEGNPDHPASLGATDVFAQAAVLALCDPDRAQVVTRLGRITTWERFAAEIAQVVAAHRAAGGTGLRILTETVTSPSLAAEIGALLAECPGARWHRFDPAGEHNRRSGLAQAFGAPVAVRYDVASADVIVSIDADFAAYGPGSLRYARDLARRRDPGQKGALGHTSAVRGALPPSAGMNRLYLVESSPTCTGTIADHRLSLRPSEVGLFAAALAAELGVLPPGGAGDIPPNVARWAAVIATDLRAAGARGLVIAGEPAIPAVHALTALMNAALGNVGTTVFYTDPVEASPVDHLTSIRELCDDMREGRVSLLVVLGGNPVYTAPADLDFAGAMSKVGLRVHLSLHPDETSELCHYHLPEAHFLETWGDARAFDGTVTLIQPLIAPLHEGRPAIEVVHAMRGRAAPVLDLVRGHHKRTSASTRFDSVWNSALQDGFFAGSSLPPIRPVLAPGIAALAAAGVAAAASRRQGYELAIRPDPTVDDGRHSNSGWLQELPKPHTLLTWDNAAIVGPRTAAELGVQTEDVVELANEGRTVRAPVCVLPGHPEGSVTVTLGYGRRSGGSVAVGLGFDAYRLRTTASLWHAPGLLVRRTGERRALAITQQHTGHHDRPHARAVTLAEMAANPAVIHEMAAEEPPKSLSLYPRVEVRGPRLGHDRRSEHLHLLQLVRRRVPVGEQHPRRGQGAGQERPRDALAPHRQVRGPEHGPGGEGEPAHDVRPLRERALRVRLPRGGDHAQRRGGQRDDVQPLRRHPVLRQQLPVQGPALQLPGVPRGRGAAREEDAQARPQPRRDGPLPRRHGEVHVLYPAHRRRPHRGRAQPPPRARRRGHDGLPASLSDGRHHLRRHPRSRLPRAPPQGRSAQLRRPRRPWHAPAHDVPRAPLEPSPGAPAPWLTRRGGSASIPAARSSPPATRPRR